MSIDLLLIKKLDKYLVLNFNYEKFCYSYSYDKKNIEVILFFVNFIKNLFGFEIL